MMEKDLELDNWLMRTGIDGNYDTIDSDIDNTITINDTETRFRIPTNHIELDRNFMVWGQETLRRTRELNYRYGRDINRDPSLDLDQDIEDADGFRYVCYRIMDYIAHQSNNPYDIGIFLETALNQGHITNYELIEMPETRNIKIVLEKNNLRYLFEIPYSQVRSSYYSDGYGVPF